MRSVTQETKQGNCVEEDEEDGIFINSKLIAYDEVFEERNLIEILVKPLESQKKYCQNIVEKFIVISETQLKHQNLNIITFHFFSSHSHNISVSYLFWEFILFCVMKVKCVYLM